METVTIGIDLGTTNTLACYMKKGKPTLLKFNGDKMLPSTLYVEKDGSYAIGHEARVKGEGDPDNMIRSSKNFMGDPNKKWNIRGRSLTPTDVAAEFLRQVKAVALKKLKKEEDTAVKAVITVPAYFSGKQKEATRKAAEQAGLEVLLIITEPMAAAVAAGRTKELKGKILVVDIGGGTFDLSILEADAQGDQYKALAIDGDSHLGGDDFDRLLYDYMMERLSEKTGMDFSSLSASGLDESDYGSLRGRVRSQVEKTKIDLSESTERDISLANLFPYQGQLYNFEITVDREQFDEISSGIYSKIFTRLENFLARQTFPVEKIESVILAGGSCYIPRIHDEVERIVHQPADTELDLDTLVVSGACIVAEHVASGIEAKGFVQDIISHSLGVEVIDNAGNSYFDPLLSRGTVYPCQSTKQYTTAVDNQTEVDINIYEAGHDAEDIDDIDRHELYGSITLDGIRLAPKGEPIINVTFEYDKNQTLRVTAEDQDTHVRKQILIRENQKAALKPKQTPLDFMLLIDASGSMRGYPLNEAKKACLALVDDMLDFSVHRLALASFANDVNLLLDLSQDTQAMREKISSITAYGGTDMVAALERANRQLLNSSRGKVVVMVTDGAPNWVDGTLRMAETLKSNGVRLIAIGVGSSIREDVLRKMASSGDAYKIDDMNQLEGTFRTAISAIMEKM